MECKSIIQALDELPYDQQLADLSHIYWDHIKSFPFHNFELREISQQHPIQRNKLTLFSHFQPKIPGGFCFQSAQSLYEKLVTRGFQVDCCIARVLNGLEVNSKEVLALPATHLVLTVDIKEKKFLLDAGLGPRAPRIPIPIQNEDCIYSQGSHQYRFYCVDNVYVLKKKKPDNEWFSLMQTDLKPATEEEINSSLLQLERFPSELGIRDTKLAAGIVTKTGNKSLFWDTRQKQFIFTIENESQVKTEKLPNAASASDKLKSELNIDIGTGELMRYCKEKQLPIPKNRWSVNEFPLNKAELDRMCVNLRHK